MSTLNPHQAELMKIDSEIHTNFTVQWESQIADTLKKGLAVQDLEKIVCDYLYDDKNNKYDDLISDRDIEVYSDIISSITENEYLSYMEGKLLTEGMVDDLINAISVHLIMECECKMYRDCECYGQEVQECFRQYCYIVQSREGGLKFEFQTMMEPMEREWIEGAGNQFYEHFIYSCGLDVLQRCDVCDFDEMNCVCLCYKEEYTFFC